MIKCPKVSLIALLCIAVYATALRAETLTYQGDSGTGKGKREQVKIQDVFNQLAAQSGEPLCRISMILAQSID